DEVLRDQRPRNRGAEQVFTLVDGIGTEHREHVVGGELLLEILDEHLLDAHRHGLGARRFDFLALADVGGERHHFAAVGIGEPLEDDGGVEPPGVGQNDLVDLFHWSPWKWRARLRGGGRWKNGDYSEALRQTTNRRRHPHPQRGFQTHRLLAILLVCQRPGAKVPGRFSFVLPPSGPAPPVSRRRAARERSSAEVSSMTRHLLSLNDLTGEEIVRLLDRAVELKGMQRRGEIYEPMRGGALAMIFEKSSTRTRVSFEVAAIQFGGNAIFIAPGDSQLGRGEPVADTARVLSS